MANPRRGGSSQHNTSSNVAAGGSLESRHHHQQQISFLKKPQSIPFLLLLFAFLTWLFLRLQHSTLTLSSSSSSSSSSSHRHHDDDGDSKSNMVRFSSAFPSPIAKDARGWLLDPVAVARQASLTGGAVSCESVHLGEIRPGSLRGNHRHHTCNETFVIWGATTKFRLENKGVVDKGYTEVTIAADGVAVIASPRGTAHALWNVDPIGTTFFLGCQDSEVNYSSSSTDFNVWKDLSS